MYRHSHSRSNTGNQGNAENDDKTFQTSNVFNLNSFVEMRITNLIGLLDFSFAIPIYKEMAISNVSTVMNQRFKTRIRKREQHVYLYKGYYSMFESPP